MSGPSGRVVATFRRRNVATLPRILRKIATTIVVATLAGCAIGYDETRGYRGVLGCINFTGPGFSLACPEGPLRTPAIPNTPQPSP